MLFIYEGGRGGEDGGEGGECTVKEKGHVFVDGRNTMECCLTAASHASILVFK